MMWIYAFVLLLAINKGTSGQATESRQTRACPTDKEIELIQAQTRILVSISENLRSVNTRLDKLGQEVARLRSRCSFRTKKYRRNWRTTRHDDELRRIKYEEPLVLKPKPISEDSKPIYTPNSKYIYDVPNSKYDQVLTEINSNDSPSVTLAVQNIGDVNYMNFKIASQDFLNRIGGSMLTISRNIDTNLYDITVGDGCYTRNKRSLELTDNKNNDTETSEFSIVIKNGDLYVDRIGTPLKIKLDQENIDDEVIEQNQERKVEQAIELQNTGEQTTEVQNTGNENTEDHNIQVDEELTSIEQSGGGNAEEKSKEGNDQNIELQNSDV